MIAKIVHFGIDCRYRLCDLRGAGYAVESCFTVPEFRLVLYVNPRLDAIIIDASERDPPRTAVELASSHCPGAVVLFQGWTAREEVSQFDLIIPPLTPVPKWLDDIANLITLNRTGQAKTREKPTEDVSALHPHRLFR
jgi:hypothetical protein